MSKSIILITGANGEMGHGLISELYKNNHDNIVALDINKIDNSIKKYCFKYITGNILDLNQWERFEEQFPATFITMYQFWCQDISQP